MASPVYVRPPRAAVDQARRALEARRRAPKSKKGGLDTVQAGKEGVGSGVARARDIIAGKRVDARQVKAFFDRHEKNYLAAVQKGLELGESRAIQSWMLWGGDPMRKAAERAMLSNKRKLMR